VDRKKIETPSEMLGYIMDQISENIGTEKDGIVYQLQDSTEFERGASYGAIQALDELRQHLRNLDKHGYDHITVEDWSGFD
jgi:predicted heme/steroid binding protein